MCFERSATRHCCNLAKPGPMHGAGAWAVSIILSFARFPFPLEHAPPYPSSIPTIQGVRVPYPRQQPDPLLALEEGSIIWHGTAAKACVQDPWRHSLLSSLQLFRQDSTRLERRQCISEHWAGRSKAQELHSLHDGSV